MIRTNKEDKEYVWVDYVDIITGINFASKENDKKMVLSLNDSFNDMDVECIMIDKKEFRKFRRNSKIVKYLHEVVKIEYYDSYVDQDVLKEALVRSYFEFNHQMKNKLSKYFRKYTENEINGVDNTILKEEIKNDKLLMEYIKEYDDFKSYTEQKIKNNVELKDKISTISREKRKVKNNKFVA